MTLQAPAYAGYFREIEDSLRNFDNILTGLERSYLDLASGNINAALSDSKDLADPKQKAVLAEYGTAISSGVERFKGIIKGLEIEVKANEAYETKFLVQVLAIIPASVYLAVFSFIAIRSYIKHRRERKKQKFKYRKYSQ